MTQQESAQIEIYLKKLKTKGKSTEKIQKVIN